MAKKLIHVCWVLALLVGAVVIGWNPGSCAAQETYLYASGWEIESNNVVYEYLGGTTWNPISEDLGEAVVCLIEYSGQVYAGTLAGEVYRYDGGMSWTLVGSGLDWQVCALIEFRGNLYASTMGNNGRLYRYDGGTTWTLVVDYSRQPDDPIVPWFGFGALYVWNDVMHMGGYDYDQFGRWDGITFTYDQVDTWGAGIEDFEVYEGEMYASASGGRVHKSSDGVSWALIRDFQPYHARGLETFLGELYLCTGPALEIYDGAIFNHVWSVPDPSQIISMMCTPDALVLGTGEDAERMEWPAPGRVYLYDGVSVQLISSDSMSGGIQALVGSGLYGPSATKATTWGAIKAMYR